MSFQRMIAIPQEEYIQLSTLQNVQQPLAQKMRELEHDYQTQTHQDPYRHLILKGSTLEEMKALKEKIRSSIELGTPKHYRSRALSLYHSIEPNIKFNDRGELMDETNQPIRNSRAEDLIQHAVRQHRRPFTPIAWSAFVNLMKKYNVPRSVLNRETLDELSQPMEKRVAKRIVKRKKVETPEWTPKTSVKRLKLEKTPLRPASSRKRRLSLRYPKTDFLLDYSP